MSDTFQRPKKRDQNKNEMFKVTKVKKKLRRIS